MQARDYRANTHCRKSRESSIKMTSNFLFKLFQRSLTLGRRVGNDYHPKTRQPIPKEPFGSFSIRTTLPRPSNPKLGIFTLISIPTR